MNNGIRAIASGLLFFTASSVILGNSPPGSSYDSRQVKNAILRDAANPIQKCFKAWEKKHPEFVSGTIHVDWHIEPSGKPTRVKIVHSDLAGLNSCVLANVKRTSFATPPGGTSHYVDHRFLFKREQK